MGNTQSVFVGEVYDSVRFGSFKVVEYVNHKEVTVNFLNTGYTTKTTVNNIKKGLVKDKLMPFVVGEGFCNAPTTDDCGNILKEYRLWVSMLTRCYCEKYLNKNPSYKDCIVSDSFKDFTVFKKWCNSQVFTNGYVLDKDILVKGNKLYSEDTCCFVPQEINLLIVNNKASRGEYPIGVTKYRENKFRARLNKGSGVVKHLGYFLSPEEAFYAYKQAKEDYIKEVANKWRDKIDPRVYEALMNWEVSVDD